MIPCTSVAKSALSDLPYSYLKSNVFFMNIFFKDGILCWESDCVNSLTKLDGWVMLHL